MEPKFEIGQRVAIREGHVGYLKAGQTGVIEKGIVLNGLPEYLVIMDKNEYSNVAGWFLREQDLVPAAEPAKYLISLWGEDAAEVVMVLTETEAEVVSRMINAFDSTPQPNYSPTIHMERK